MEWKEEHDVPLCREILASQPYQFKERTVERGIIWEEISNRLNNCQRAKFRVTKRSVRDRFQLNKEKFKRKIREEESLSGTDVEPAVHWKNLPRWKPQTRSKLRQKKTNTKQKKYAKMESYSQTKTRLTTDETHAEPKKN